MALKVLIISQMYPSSADRNRGIFVHRQVKELVRQGCEVRVVSPVPLAPFPIRNLSKRWRNYSNILFEEKADNIKVYHPRYVDFPKALFFSFSGERMYRGIKNAISDLYRDFEFNLIHAHTVLPSGYAAMEIAKEYKKPLFITVHGADFQKTIFKNKRCKNAVIRVISFSKKIIMVSNKLKKIGQKELSVESNKIEVIPNGTVKEDIFEGKSNLLEKYKAKNIILSVSNLVKTKGLDFNIKAIKKLEKNYPSLIYLIIGKGQEKKELERLVKELKLEKKVEFLGQLRHKKIMEYVSICDIFSLPSWDEGFGIVYLEAMAQGKPTIACKGEGPEDFIIDRENGILVKPKDIDNLSEAIDFLLSHQDKLMEIAKKAKDTIFEKYTLDKVVGRIITLYNE